MPSEIKSWVFTDLDDMLFQTRRKMPEDGIKIAGAYDSSGQLRSFMSPQQAQLIQMLTKQGAMLIPVTGRPSYSFKRHALGSNVFGDYRIVAHGAVVLDQNDQLFLPWFNHAEKNFDLQYWHDCLSNLMAKIDRFVAQHNLPVRTRCIFDNGLPAYICSKSTDHDQSTSVLSQVVDFISDKTPENMRIHLNGNNLALLAPLANKSNAVAFVAQQLGISQNDLVIGMGDSLTDLPFIRQGHFGVFPIGSQIDQGILE